MMKLGTIVGAGLALCVLLIALPGCQKEGPAEHAGKAVDNAMEKTGQQIEKVGQDIEDTAKGEKK